MKKHYLLTLTLLLTACGDFYDAPHMNAPGEVDKRIQSIKGLPNQSDIYPALKVKPENTVQNSPSLWNVKNGSVFGDKKNKQIGDIITVNIDIDDNAEFKGDFSQSDSSNNKLAIGSFFGLEKKATEYLPDGATLDPAIKTGGANNASGKGSIKRNEKINLKVAAVISDILPNGHLVIYGSQEVRVNFELRELQVSGVVRPEDISRRNTVSYEKIAEARISYGGRGLISKVQQPKYGTQIINELSPF